MTDNEINENKEMVTIIVQRKDGQKLIDALMAAGVPGATFYYARGTGVRQRLGLLGRFIDAEKQVILVVCKVGQSGIVFDTLKKVIGPDITGKGFAFVQTVNKVLGFSEAKV